MRKQRDEFCGSVKKQYPAISAKADKEYARLWDDFTDSEYYSYSWFEALANALNNEMNRGVPEAEYRDLFLTISDGFEAGDEDVQKAIDVAFVENLFWRVPADRAAGYWAALPENLRRLYVQFHHKTPL